MNNFYTAITYEKSKWESADAFYKHLIYNVMYKYYPKEYINIDIKRWDFNSTKGRKMQLNDIDVTIQVTINNPANDIIYKQWNISEKFRTSNHNDMFIELYSKFPTTIGWGNNTKADIICYFTPDNVYIIKTSCIKNFVASIFDKFDKNDMIRIFGNSSNLFGVTSMATGTIDKNRLLFIKTPTFINNKFMWEGVGVCIPWDDFEKYNMNFKKYSYPI